MGLRTRRLRFLAITPDAGLRAHSDRFNVQCSSCRFGAIQLYPPVLVSHEPFGAVKRSPYAQEHCRNPAPT